MAKSTEEMKQAALKILEAVQSIYPQLADVSKMTDFSITITGDKKSVYTEFSVDWDPTADPKAVDIKEGVDVADAEEIGRITDAFMKADGDKRKAAEMLGLSERTFDRKLKEYRIELSKH